MNTAYIALSPWDLVLAGSLILINAGISIAFSLGIHRTLFIAAARMVVQLLLVGTVLTTLFATTSPFWTATAALVMTLFAGYEIAQRQTRPLAGLWSFGLGAASMMLSSWLVTAFALIAMLGAKPWYDPHYAIPLLGMVLGNCMSAIALGLDTLTGALVTRKSAVEARLMLGGTRKEAFGPVVREALRRALMPMISSMSATGVVAIPGMMTGQILGGTDPAEAAKYQILIMFLLSGATALAAVIAILAGAMRLTDHRHRLRIDRIATKNKT
jgi:putative ABC transport system permease protein